MYKDIALDSNCVIELVDILTNNKTIEYIQPSSSSLFPHSYHMVTTSLYSNTCVVTRPTRDTVHFSRMISINNTLKVIYYDSHPSFD